MAKILCLYFLSIAFFTAANASGLPLYYWSADQFENFGDYLSLKLVENITNNRVRSIGKNPFINKQKLLAIGSILQFANDKDVVWASGIHGTHLCVDDYRFSSLDVRAIRGPLSRQFLMDNFSVECPEIYGDPALLLPYLFPELKRSEDPMYDYIVIPHCSEEKLFPKRLYPHVVHPSEPWDIVIEKILNSKFVISSSLHGIVVAEAFGIPARLLRITENEPLFKYMDYYLGTGRSNFQFARSIESALKLGGEAPAQCDLKKLYEAFPFEFWPGLQAEIFDFNQNGN